MFWPPLQAGQPRRNLRNDANFRHPLYYWRKQKIMPITQLEPDHCPPCPEPTTRFALDSSEAVTQWSLHSQWGWLGTSSPCISQPKQALLAMLAAKIA